jgi:cytochrome c oxidase cbb3-type subunit 4
MEINLMREVMTVLSFLAFAGIVAYALNPRNRARFEEAARLPLDDDRPFNPGEEGR